MKKLLFTIITMSFLISGAIAQNQNGKSLDKSREKIEAKKIAFLTNRLDLSVAQAQKFWPLYNEYSRKTFEIKKSLRKARINKMQDNVDEKEWSKRLELMTQLKKKEADLEARYKDKFLKILSAKQVLILYKSEGEFIDHLRKEVVKKKSTTNHKKKK